MADRALVAIADYVKSAARPGDLALAIARACAIDALAQGFTALRDPACRRFVGPLVRGATMNGGARVPGTSYELDPVKAAFDVGAITRWTADATRSADAADSDDGVGAAEPAAQAHPCDCLGGLLAVADWRSRRTVGEGGVPLTMDRLFAALVSAYELQRLLEAQNDLPALGLDGALFARVATAAVATALIDGTHEQVMDAVALALLDGAPLRGAHHAGTRAPPATAEATSRGVRFALLALNGATGPRDVLSDARRGFEAVVLRRAFACDRPFGWHAMESLPFGLQPQFEASVAAHFPIRQAQAIVAMFADVDRLPAMPVHEFVSALVRNGG